MFSLLVLGTRMHLSLREGWPSDSLNSFFRGSRDLGSRRTAVSEKGLPPASERL